MNLLRRMFGRMRFEEDLDREVDGYLRVMADRYAAQGMSLPEAYRAARLQMEGREQIKEKVREVGMGAGVESALKQFRYVLRSMAKSPGFTMLAFMTLALVIGASTAIFTVVDTVLLRPLTYRDSGELVVAWERVRFIGPEPVGPNERHVDLWRKRATAFSALTMLRQGATGLEQGNEHPRLIGTVTAYTNLFAVLKVTPFIGRLFEPGDGVSGRDHVAVLTYPLWQSLFQGNTHVIGTMVRLGGSPIQVVGVLPADFRFPNANSLAAFHSKQRRTNVQEPALFLPAVVDLNRADWNGDYGNWIALGRLRPGFTAKQAEMQLTSLGPQIMQAMPSGARDDRPDALRASVQPMQEAVAGESTTGLWFLLAAVLGLVLIGCVNLANAQLGRVLSRSREAAVRCALGASKWQLLWTSLAESLTLAIAGGMGGIALAFGALKILRQYSPVDIPRLAEMHMDTMVLGFTLALCLGSTILFGTIPAVRMMRTDPQLALQQNNSRNLGSRQSRPLRNLLIAMQVFGCSVLLLVTGLFSKSLVHLLHEDKGFDADDITIAETDLSRQVYGSAQSRIQFVDGVLSSLRGMAGVESAAMISAMPVEGESWIEGLRRTDRPNQEIPLLNLRWVSRGYFETTRQKLVAGRFFEERDQSLRNVIISEGEARAGWPNETPLGAQVEMEGRKFTVIGVVADSRITSLKSEPAKIAYAYFTDRPPYATFFLVRGAHSGTGLGGRVRQAIWNRYPETTIARVTTLNSQISDSVSIERFQTGVLIAFGAAALMLAMLGIYAVLSYAVAGRTQEIGVRMALGATRKTIFALAFGESSAPVIGGLVAGLATGAVAARAVQKLLYGVEPLDWLVIVSIAVLFVVSAAAAAFVPARRAASIDPMKALRAD
jgi:predicted permease